MEFLTASVAAAEYCGKAYTLATLAGEIDLMNSGDLRHLLESAVAEGARMLVVDLSGVSFMDSSALNALLLVTRMLQRQGGALALVSPRGAVDKVLRVCAADQLMPICTSVAEAVDG